MAKGWDYRQIGRLALGPSPLRAVLPLLVSLGAATNMLAQPTVSFTVSPIPGVAVISSGSSNFAGAIQSLVDPSVLQVVDTVLPFSYVLKNESGKTIIVYSTRWTLTDSSGRTTTQDCTWWNLSTLRGGDAIAPGTSRLVSPVYRLGIAAGGQSGLVLSQTIQKAMSEFLPCRSIVVSLETVIFDDGSALGPDSTNATAIAQAYLDGERQVSDQISTGGDVKQILNSLATVQRDAAGQPVTTLSNPPTYQEFLAMRRQSVSATWLKIAESEAGEDRLRQIQAGIAQKRGLNIRRP